MIEQGDEKDRFWDAWSETLIAGGVAWLLSDCPKEERTLGRLFDLFTQGDVVYNLAAMLDSKKVTQRTALSAFSAFLSLPTENTRPAVLGSVQAHLRLFDSDLARRVTDKTTIDLDGFIRGKPMTLYIIVPPYRLSAYRPLLRMWLSGLLLALTRRGGTAERKDADPLRRDREPREGRGLHDGDDVDALVGSDALELFSKF
jgi:type IV secretion system protein VirD4